MVIFSFKSFSPVVMTVYTCKDCPTSSPSLDPLLLLSVPPGFWFLACVELMTEWYPSGAINALSLPCRFPLQLAFVSIGTLITSRSAWLVWSLSSNTAVSHLDWPLLWGQFSLHLRGKLYWSLHGDSSALDSSDPSIFCFCGTWELLVMQLSCFFLHNCM